MIYLWSSCSASAWWTQLPFYDQSLCAIRSQVSRQLVVWVETKTLRKQHCFCFPSCSHFLIAFASPNPRCETWQTFWFDGMWHCGSALLWHSFCWTGHLFPVSCSELLCSFSSLAYCVGDKEIFQMGSRKCLITYQRQSYQLWSDCLEHSWCNVCCWVRNWECFDFGFQDPCRFFGNGKSDCHSLLESVQHSLPTDQQVHCICGLHNQGSSQVWHWCLFAYVMYQLDDFFCKGIGEMVVWTVDVYQSCLAVSEYDKAMNILFQFCFLVQSSFQGVVDGSKFSSHVVTHNIHRYGPSFYCMLLVVHPTTTMDSTTRRRWSGWTITKDNKIVICELINVSVDFLVCGFKSLLFLLLSFAVGWASAGDHQQAADIFAKVVHKQLDLFVQLQTSSCSDEEVVWQCTAHWGARWDCCFVSSWLNCFSCSETFCFCCFCFFVQYWRPVFGFWDFHCFPFWSTVLCVPKS